MNRREALTTIASSALAATASGLGLNALPGAATTSARNPRPPDRPIRVALIGAKNMGGVTHLPTLVGESQCRLATICDVDDTVRAQAVAAAIQGYEASGPAPVIRSTGDYREVMSDPSIDAVVIATPDHWHVPLARTAVLSGKDVYVEKPLSLYVSEGRELVELARDRDVIVQVGSQHRSSDRFFLATAIVQSGMLGRITHAEVAINTRSGQGIPWEAQAVPPELNYDRWLGPAAWTDYHPDRVHYNFRFVPDFSGGDITNWGAHFLDSIQQMLGLDGTGPARVEGTGKRHPAGSLHSTFYDIHVDYEYADGTTFTLKSATPRGITVIGDRATLVVNRDTLYIDSPDLMQALPKAEAHGLRRTRGSHLQNWLSCIGSRRKADVHAPLEVAHRSAILCHLANIAIELRRPLRWDAGREIFVDDAHANAMLSRSPREHWEQI